VLVATYALSGLLAFVFLGGSLGKLTRAKSQVATAERLHIPWDRYRLIGIPEGAASLGLLAGLAVPLIGAAAAIGVALLMSGAVFSRLRVHDSVAFVAGDSLFVAAALAATALRIATA
jgi:hypothetical protein